MRRLAVVAVVLAAALTGCVQNLPVGAADWLAGRDGIAEARILTDDTGPWSSGGLEESDNTGAEAAPETSNRTS